MASKDEAVAVLQEEMSTVKDSLKAIASSLQSLAVVENNSKRSEDEIKGLREELQNQSILIARLPTVTSVEKLETRVGKAENRVTALEASQTTSRWIVGLLVVVVVTLLGSLIAVM